MLGDGWYAGRLQGGRKCGTAARAARPAEDHLRRRHEHPRSAPTAPGRPAAAACRPTSIYDGETYDARLEAPAGTSPASTAAGANAVERNETMAVEPDAGASDQASCRRSSRSSSRSRTPAPTSSTSARTSPAGRGSRAGRRRARRSRCASPRCSTPTARSTPPTCAPRSDRHVHAAGTGGTETYEPRFTFHGFRYVEVHGLPRHADARHARPGRVVSVRPARDRHVRELQPAGEPAPEQHRLGPARQLPRRADRLPAARRAAGLDRRHPGLRPHRRVQRRRAAASSPSGCRRCATRRRADGAFPDVAPARARGDGTAGWGDAGIIVPWALYQRYGDTRVLQTNYDAMTRWIDYLQANSSDLIVRNRRYGDWLASTTRPPRT